MQTARERIRLLGCCAVLGLAGCHVAPLAQPPVQLRQASTPVPAVATLYADARSMDLAEAKRIVGESADDDFLPICLAVRNGSADRPLLIDDKSLFLGNGAQLANDPDDAARLTTAVSGVAGFISSPFNPAAPLALPLMLWSMNKANEAAAAQVQMLQFGVYTNTIEPGETFFGCVYADRDDPGLKTPPNLCFNVRDPRENTTVNVCVPVNAS